MEILEYCFESIVPANGNQQIMNLATHVCNDNNLDGVASWLSKKFNIEKGFTDSRVQIILGNPIPDFMLVKHLSAMSN